MKSIAWINLDVPGDQDFINFDSGDSLRDYDIIVFNPELPYHERISFTGGGSCISIEGTAYITEALSHWRHELNGALASGKTVFIILNTHEEDKGAVGSATGARGARNYQTTTISNYSSVPGNIQVRNSRGKRIIVKDSSFKNIYAAISEIAEYRVVFEAATSMRTVFVAKDGTTVGGVIKNEKWPGSLVLLPYFDFTADDLTEEDSEGEDVWNKKALSISHAIISQLIAIDKTLRRSVELTPVPNWISDFSTPKDIVEIDGTISAIDAQIEELNQRRNEQVLRKEDVSEYLHLLYETGKPLEVAIEKALRLLGYTVETLRIGDLEIDHVITGPSGIRMIGESEGKDSSAIDISKFRQLESNIGEDFEREEITKPAKGLLFGNGFRLTAPADRAEQFTQKSLTNAARLGSALIRTSDIYAVSLHLLDNPADDDFRTACRDSIESTIGGIVQFPKPLA